MAYTFAQPAIEYASAETNPNSMEVGWRSSWRCALHQLLAGASYFFGDDVGLFTTFGG